MAEFTHVIREWARMCGSHEKCPDCPLGRHECECELCSPQDAEQVERIITGWAAEHPEPVYPTWREFIYDYCVKLNPDLRGCNDYQFVAVFMGESIPADIAQKLGIEPKEG